MAGTGAVHVSSGRGPFVVHDGRISFTADGQTRAVGPGDSVTPELIERMLEAGPRHSVGWILPAGGDPVLGAVTAVASGTR